jgi:hypothetical protein
VVSWAVVHAASCLNRFSLSKEICVNQVKFYKKLFRERTKNDFNLGVLLFF